MVGTSIPRKSSQPTIKYGAERARRTTNSVIRTKISTAPPVCHHAQWLGIGYGTAKCVGQIIFPKYRA